MTSPSVPERPRTRARTRLALLLGGTLVGLLLAEGSMRVKEAFWPGPFTTFLTYPRSLDEYQLYERVAGPLKVDLRPDMSTPSLKTNSLALRDREYALTKPAGTVRVLALGDSVTFGVQLRDGEPWESRLEVGLEGGPCPVEVLNFGVPGYNMEQSLLRFRKRGPALDPDLVLLQWGTNDDFPSPVMLLDKDHFVYVNWADGEAMPGPMEALPEAANAWLIASSALWRQVGFRLFVWYEQVTQTQVTRYDNAARNRNAVRDLHLELEQRGIPLLVVVFPRLDGGNAGHRDARRSFIERLAEEGIEHLNLAESLAGIDLRQFELDSSDAVHFNAAGNQLIANRIEAELARRGWPACPHE